jgi:uncharacterized damage-inducible protein DinB
MLTTFAEEFRRFNILFDRLVNETNLWIARTPPDRLEWLPVDNGNVRFGDRVSHVTIKSLYIHMAVAEHLSIRRLRDCAPGELLPLPRDPELTSRLANGDFLAEGMQLRVENMRTLRSFDDAVLGKTVRFAGDQTTWSVMGFLWGLFGHRAYHLGNIDIYVRQADTPAPDFYSFNPKQMA